MLRDVSCETGKGLEHAEFAWRSIDTVRVTKADLFNTDFGVSVSSSRKVLTCKIGLGSRELFWLSNHVSRLNFNAQQGGSVLRFTYNAETCKHGCTRPPSFQPVVHSAQSREDILTIHTCLAGDPQLVCEYVHHQLAIALGLNVAMAFLVQELFQLRRIDEISVMSKANSVRVIGKKWLFRFSQSAYLIWEGEKY